MLHDAGFTPEVFRPEDDSKLLDYGVGITDLVKGVAQSHDRGLDFGGTALTAEHIVSVPPAWVAFNGLTAGRASRLDLARKRDVELGRQSWTIGSSDVFLLPSSSGAHVTMPYDAKLHWWRDLFMMTRSDSV